MLFSLLLLDHVCHNKNKKIYKHKGKLEKEIFSNFNMPLLSNHYGCKKVFFMKPISETKTIQSITQNCTASSVETRWLLHISSVLQWMNHFEEREQISSPISYLLCQIGSFCWKSEITSFIIQCCIVSNGITGSLYRAKFVWRTSYQYCVTWMI